MRFAILCLLLLLDACQSAPRADFELTDQRRPALWRVTDPVGGNSGFLFGTIHMLPEGVEWQTKPLLRALEASDRLVKELAPGNIGFAVDDPSGPAGDETVPPLAERLSASDYRQIETLSKRQSLSLSRLDLLESWSLALLLSRGQHDGLQLESWQGVDAVLERRFQHSDRPIIGLDTASEQLARFDDMPDSAQDLMLRLAIADGTDAGSVRKDFETLVNAWLSGDIERLGSDADGPFADPVIREALLIEPNQKWARQIGRMLRAGERPFVAVGAKHLIGPNSLRALLSAQALDVERIQ